MSAALLHDEGRRLEAARWLLQSLVRIPTENPPGDTRPAVDFLQQIVRESGWNSLRVGDGVAQSLLTWIGTAGPTFVLNAHLDTVAAGDLDQWSAPPFEGRIAEGRLYGRGAADNKAGVTAAVLALAALNRMPPPGVRIAAMLVADEETGGHEGTGRAIRDGHLDRLDARAALVCDGSGQEGGRWGVRVATKGALGLEITTRGVAVHASRPAQGKNAVLAAADALLRLSYSGVADRPAHPVLGVPTLVAGTMIQGGTTANTIPATCRATVDCRLVPGLPVEDLIARVTEIVAGAAAAWGCTATVAVVHHTPSVSIDPAHPLVRMACEAIGEVTGQQAAIRGLPGGNDARHLVAHGIPTVIGLSPSDSSSSRSHGADENVGLADVVTASHIYAALVRRWASSVAPAE